MRVAIITTSRADWNSLQPVAEALRQRGVDGVDVDVILPVDHLGSRAVQDDWAPSQMTFLDPEHDTHLIDRDAGLAISLRFALEHERPDWALVCGDRHETLVAAFCVAAMGIPLAHLSGGDVSGGSLDERWRHAITKMADLHFPTHHLAARRLIAMGEEPARVHMLGSPAIDRLRATPVMPLAETTKALGLPDSRPFILCNWQPATPRDDALEELLQALSWDGRPVVCVDPNPDPGGLDVIALLDGYGKKRPDWRLVHTLPPAVYLSALAHADVLVGNSSSGFYEAPWYGTQVIDVGTRQLGRGPIPICMTRVPALKDMITEALLAAQHMGKAAPEFPFGKGEAAPAIAAVLLAQDKPGNKLFFESARWA